MLSRAGAQAVHSLYVDTTQALHFFLCLLLLRLLFFSRLSFFDFFEDDLRDFSLVHTTPGGSKTKKREKGKGKRETKKCG